MATYEQLARVYGFVGEDVTEGSPQALADAVCRALETPDARTSEACANALWKLASDDAEVTFSGSKEALRRVGYLADQLSQYADAPAKLERWAESLWEQPETDLVLTSRVTNSRLRRLMTSGSDVNARWKVWGQAELRAEFL